VKAILSARAASARVAHASRVLVSASRRNNLSLKLHFLDSRRRNEAITNCDRIPPQHSLSTEQKLNILNRAEEILVRIEEAK